MLHSVKHRIIERRLDASKPDFSKDSLVAFKLKLYFTELHLFIGETLTTMNCLPRTTIERSAFNNVKTSALNTLKTHQEMVLTLL